MQRNSAIFNPTVGEQVQPNHRVELNWLDFDVEEGYGRNCTYDYVAVYDGPTADSPGLGVFCGDSLPAGVLRSTSNEMFVRLKSDGDTSSRGFRANFSTVSLSTTSSPSCCLKNHGH